jgi:tetratricopeptide (TPR) repeat protein
VLASGGVKPAVSQLDEADGAFAQVADMDKKWAAPIVQRGFIAFRKALLIGSGDPRQIPKWLDVAAKYADQALAIAPQDADGLELRGTVRFFRWSYNQAADANARKSLQDAEADFKAATTANPVQATAWNGLSYVLNSENQFAQAKLAAQRAYESDPYLKDAHKTIWRLFQNSVELGNRTEAERWCNTGRQRFPDNFRFTECRLWLYNLPGKASADSVWKAYRDFLDQSPANAKPFHQLKGGMLVALGLIRAGVSPDSARSVAMRSRAGQDADPVGELLVYEAHFRAQIGDTDEAIKLLTKFFANNPPQRAFAKDDDSWWWDPIRQDSRYKALVSSGG